MRNTSLWITASLAVALVCGCKSKESKQPESKAAGSVDPVGTFTCKHVQNERAADSDAPCVDSTDHFDAAAPVVHMTYRTLDLPKSGDTYVVQWIATDLGQAAPANTLIATINQDRGLDAGRLRRIKKIR